LLSGGRFDLGIGIGWLEEEFHALGLSTFARRGAVADEQLRVLEAVWTNEVIGFEGEFYRFDAVGAHPRPLQTPHPPIWVGGHSRAALRRVARYGDGWFPHRGGPVDLSPAEVAASLNFIRQEAVRLGRDPAGVRVRLSTGVALLDRPDDKPRPFAGTP